jgi:hypothetical protein
LLNQCFSRYLAWVIENDAANLQQYDLLTLLAENNVERLAKLEESLGAARLVLRLETHRFVELFGFRTDLLTADPEKVHEIIGEPLFVLNLHENLFSCIEKLPPSLEDRGINLPSADFTASRGPDKFAIELKTVRTETGVVPGKFIGDPLKPYWWGEMFRKNSATKIEDKDRRVLAQLANTARLRGCRYKMVAIYTRRLGPSTLMSASEWRDELKALKATYREIEFFCVKDYFAHTVFYPDLPA